MRGEGADGPVVAMKPGNAGGAKGPDDLAEGIGQRPLQKRAAGSDGTGGHTGSIPAVRSGASCSEDPDCLLQG